MHVPFQKESSILFRRQVFKHSCTHRSIHPPPSKFLSAVPKRPSWALGQRLSANAEGNISWLFSQNIYCSSIALPRLLSSPGLISLLEYQQAKNRSASETTMENTVSTIAQQSGSSIRVVSLPEHNSIVPSNHVHTDHVHSDHMREAHTPKVSQIQKRRVTWALWVDHPSLLCAHLNENLFCKRLWPGCNLSENPEHGFKKKKKSLTCCTISFQLLSPFNNVC